MQDEVGVLAAKSAATAGTAVAAVFGLTWWAVAASLVGAVMSLHFERPAAGSTVWRVLLQIAALGFLAAFLAVFLPYIPLFGWTAPEALPSDVALVVRAGLLGIFANPINTGIRALIRRRGEGG
jgi:hypothetical protein